jgi:peptide deformylase
MFQIKKYKDKSLSTLCREVTPEEFGPELDKTLSDMAVTMYASRGVGLAAPQVGLSIRVLVADIGYCVNKQYGNELLKMINPRLLSTSEETVKAEEQCLSFPSLKVQVERPLSIKVSYQTLSGEVTEQEFEDWQARIILHEMEHLDGVTLYSKAGKLTKNKYKLLVKENPGLLK